MPFHRDRRRARRKPGAERAASLRSGEETEADAGGVKDDENVDRRDEALRESRGTRAERVVAASCRVFLRGMSTLASVTDDEAAELGAVRPCRVACRCSGAVGASCACTSAAATGAVTGNDRFARAAAPSGADRQLRGGLGRRVVR